MRYKFPTRIFSLIVVLALVVAAGLYLNTRSSAATSLVVAEVEAGTSAGSACDIADTTASGGSATRFGCGSATGVQARRTSDFLDSLGVVTHIGADRYANMTEITSTLNYLGIHNLRMAAGNDTRLTERRTVIAAGNKINFIAFRPNTEPNYPTPLQVNQSIDSRLNDIKDNGFIPGTTSVEPFNEYDGKANFGNPEWFKILQNSQPYLFNQSRLKLGTGVKVLGPSLIGNDAANTAEQVGNLSGYLDYGNLHSYYGGKKPESAFRDATPATANFQSTSTCAALTASLTIDDRLTAYATCISKNKPMIITETGYHDDPTSTTHKFTSRAATATYMPRLFLEMFRIGVARTYVYELLDEPTKGPPTFERHLGFVDAAGIKKPHAVTVHNLTSLLADTGTTSRTFAPGKLDYSVSGTTANLRKMVFQKSDGSYWLALWQNISVFNHETGDDLTGVALDTKPVTLTLAQPATPTVYQNSTTTATSLPRGTTANLMIGPKVTLVKLVP